MTLPRWTALLALTLCFYLGSGTARADVDFDVAVGLDVNDDTRIFLNVTNQTWYPKPTAAPLIIEKCHHPGDDFPVIAFLAYHSHRSPQFILGLRAGGNTWWEVFYQLGVGPAVLFEGIRHDPGPPYGKAWGHWRRHSRSPRPDRYHISDADIVGLIKVQTTARHFGVSPHEVLKARKQVRRLETYAANRWRDQHGRSKWGEKPGSNPKGKNKKSTGQDHSKGKGRGKGKAQGH